MITVSALTLQVQKSCILKHYLGQSITTKSNMSLCYKTETTLQWNKSKGFPYRALSPELIPVYRQSARTCRSAAITFRQARSYLPRRRASLTLGRYQVILLGDRGTYVWTSLPKVVMQLLPQVGSKPTTCWSQVQRSTHCATAPP